MRDLHSKADYSVDELPVLPATKNNLLAERKACAAHKQESINDVIAVETPLVSFGQFISGKVLGSTL